MAKWRDISIKYKMMLIIMLISSIALLIACIAFVTLDFYNYREKIADQLHILSDVVGDNNTANLLFTASSEADASLFSLRANENIVAACIYMPNGNKLATYVRKDIKDHIEFPRKKQNDIFIGNDHIEVFRPIMLKDEEIGTIYLKSDLRELYERRNKFLSIGVGILLISLSIAFFISARLQRIITAPILKLVQIESEVSRKKDYSIRVEKTSNDEVGTLIGGFNEMLGQIEQQNKELVEAKELAEQSEKAKESFLANMSHEIRTPMNAILGMANLLHSTPLNSVQQKYLDAINISGNSLMVIINDILDFSKIEAGKLSFETIGFKPQDVIEHLVASVQYKLTEKSIIITPKISEKVNQIVLGDPVRLNQILLNLVNNAIKFTPQGTIDIICEDEKEDEKNLTLKFTVSDTGIGISKEKMDKIFESFSQADVSTTRKFGGTGLGLTISKNLVELQNGSISVESEEGKGSVFSFIIPYKKGTEADVPKTEHTEYAAESLTNVKVLVVDDHEMNRLLAASIIGRWKFEVETAVDGKEAIEKLEKDNYDIILMDMLMPVMDGIEATKHIRNELPKEKAGIPIIAVTANAMKGDREKCIEAGMNDYVAKPFDPKELYNKMAYFLKDKKIILTPVKTTATITEKTTKDALYNLNVLEDISGGDKKFIKKMIDSIIDETPTMLNSLKEEFSKQDWQAIGKTAHKLKPVVDYLNIELLKEDIRTLQDNGKEEKNLDEIPALVEKIIHVLEETIHELRKED